MGLEPAPVLYSFRDAFRKRGDKAFTVVIFEYLCPVFRHQARNIDIEHLPCFKAYFMVIALGQSSAVDMDDFYLVGVGYLFKYCKSLSKTLSSTFFNLFSLSSYSRIRIRASFLRLKSLQRGQE